MGKVTAKEAILNLLAAVDVKKPGNEKLMGTLLDKLSQSSIAQAKTEWTKADSEELQQRITGKPVLEKFYNRDFNPVETKFVVQETPRSTMVEGLLKTGGGGLQFHPSDKIGPIYKEDGSFGYFEFLKLQRSIQVHYNNNPDPLIYATVSTPINIITQPRKRIDLSGTGIEKKVGRKTGFEIGKKIRVADLDNILVGGILTAIGSAYTLSKGTIWVKASLFRSGTQPTEYIGFRITKGTLAFPLPTSIVQDKINIAPAVKFSMSLELDHSTTTAASNSEYGVDARAAKVSLPGNIQLQFNQNGFLEIETDDPSSLEIYENRYTLLPGSGAVGKRTADSNDYYTALNVSKDPLFEVKECRSRFFHIAGSSSIQRAYWMLACRNIQPGQPTVLETNGAIGFQLGDGLQCLWKGVEEETQLIKPAKPFLLVTSLGFQLNDEDSNFFQQRESYSLWQTDTGKDNSLSLSFAQKRKLGYICYAQDAEGLFCLADANFLIDRPFQADGSRISPAVKNCLYIKIASEKNRQMQLFWPDTTNKEPTNENPLKDVHQFAIKNAFFSTSAPVAVWMNGDYDDKNRLTSGDIKFIFGLLNLEPILPHPYAFNNAWSKFRGKGDGRTSPVIGAVQCICLWDFEEGPDVNIDFALPSGTQQLIAGWFRGDQELFKQYQQKGTKTNGGDLTATYPNIKGMCTLLDVSTGYDHLGISFLGRQHNRLAGTVSTQSDNEVSISRMFLQAPMQQLAGVTLPHVTWEPYFNLTPPEVSGNPQDPEPGLYSFNTQAEPSMFFQSGVEKINMDPLAYMRNFKEHLRASETRVSPAVPTAPLGLKPERNSGVFFSLPHGKLAMAKLSAYDPQQATFHQRQYEFIQPVFDDGSIAGSRAKGGWQFRIAANFQNNFLPPYQEGWAFQLSNVENDQSPLGITPHGFFQKVFFQNPDTPTKGVPITHLDFSGYGASTYSNWVNPEAKYATVAQAKFDMLKGRVAHEIIQVVSVIYPWGIAVTRTISFYKRNNAILYREDSGWVAKSDGIFDFSNKENNVFEPNPYEIHPGHINGLFNIRNIKEIATEVDDLGTSPDTGTIAVSFDADVDIDHISSAKTNGMVPGWGFKGYLQLSPQDKPIDVHKLKVLFDRKQNTIGGNVDCVMQIAGGDQVMLVKRVDVSMNNNNLIVAAPRGSVQLPADGSWSVVQINKQTNEVSPVANKLSIPVYRKGLRRKNTPEFIVDSPDKNSHITSPDALFDSNASPQYGYVQNTGTQKLIFPNPFYDKNLTSQLLSDPTKLADSFTLMNSKGIFPNIDKAINAENPGTSVTEIVAGGLKKVINKTVNDRGVFNIVGEPNDPFRIYAEYKAGSKDTVLEYITNSESVEDAWKNQMDNMSVHVDMGPFQPIMTISGNFNAGNGIKAEIGTGENAPQLKLPGALDKIYKVIEFLDSLDFNDLGNNAEAVKKGLQVFMSNGADAWEYKFKAEKEIPMVKFPFDPINYNSPTTPLKLDAFFKMGCYFNMPIKIPNTIDQLTPSIGAFLELKADIRVMCVSLAAATIYAKGTAVVGLAADLNNPPTLYFKFGFGVELCVGLPVIGSVSLTYLAGIDMSINSKIFTVGAFLYFRGRVELAFGLVEVAISIEAAGKIEKPDGQPCSVIAAVTFSLEVSVAFVIDLDFTETWTEKRQIA